jgi:TonB-dependent SusC/RagA subfamily outer membrane receptor
MKVLHIIILLSFYSTFGFTTIYNFLPSPTIQSSAEKITILWDASYSLINKDKKKELEFIDAYFKKIKNADVSLIVFSKTAQEAKSFKILNGNTVGLKNAISEVYYDGFAIIPSEVAKMDTDKFLFFSDGKGYAASAYQFFNKPVIAINSSQDKNSKWLHNLAFHTFGQFVDLNQISIPLAMEKIESGEQIVNEIVEENNISTAFNEISGVVTDEQGALDGANIRVEGGNNGTYTDVTGSYTIAATKGEILMYSFINKKTIKVKVGEANIINVLLPTLSETLDEVVINADKADETEYVKTAFGDRNKSSVGYAVQTITEDDINVSATDIGQAIAGKFSGVEMKDNNNLGSLIIRHAFSFPVVTGVDESGRIQSKEMYSIYPMIILDGVKLPRSVSDKIADYNVIDPQNVKDITILKGLAATNRYGQEGGNGVILITTKTGSHQFRDTNNTEKYVPPSLKEFTGNLQVVPTNTTSIFRDLVLDNTKNLDYETYISYREQNKNNASYFIETANLFYQSGEIETSDRILSNVREQFDFDTNALRALAFIYSERKQFKEALTVYERILEISPTETQNYLDVAIAKGNTGEYNEAINMFTALLNGNLNQKLDFSPIRSQSVIAFKKLLGKRNQSWNTASVPKKYFTPATYDMRIEMNWTGYDARFKVNIIQPDKKLLFWAHNEAENDIELREELTSGITSKQLNFITADKGTWYFNIIDVPENNTNTPQYLLFTVYSDYGKPTEKKVTKLLKLETSLNGKTFAKIEVN